MIGLGHYLTVAGILFVIGIFSFLKNERKPA